jgi:hypothetical protein
MAKSRGTVPPSELSDSELRKELKSIYRTREYTFLNGTPKALKEHTDRMFELEGAFRRRFPQETKPAARRTRAGARRGGRAAGTKRKPQLTTLRSSR